MISFIVPTIGRESLRGTLASIETREGDEILVIGTIRPTGDMRPRYFPCAPGNDWGCKERMIGIENARGRYLAFIDDDDQYVPGHRQAMAAAMFSTPARPILFQMQYPNGNVLWQEPTLRCGNVSTQMILIPNVPSRLGQWTTRREGDFDFLSTMLWSADDIAWRQEVIAMLGHNDPA